MLTSLQAVLLLSIVGFLVLFAKHDAARFVYFVIYVNMTALRSWHGSPSAPPNFRPVVFEMRFWLKITIIDEVLEC